MAEQIVQVQVDSENGCDILQEEYSVYLIGIIGGIELTENGGESDYHRIKEGIDTWLTENKNMFENDEDSDTKITLTLSERYERQDVFTTKWFEVDNFHAYEQDSTA